MRLLHLLCVLVLLVVRAHANALESLVGADRVSEFWQSWETSTFHVDRNQPQFFDNLVGGDNLVQFCGVVCMYVCVCVCVSSYITFFEGVSSALVPQITLDHLDLVLDTSPSCYVENSPLTDQDVKLVKRTLVCSSGLFDR
jgi:hypothetical protein